jgi:hypothetical protein
MKENEKDVEQGFYEECAKLLNCAEHTYRAFPYRKRTRWNNRAEGNGRFPGFGLIRMFSPNLISVAVKTPALQGQYSSTQAALDAIKSAIARN